MFSGGSHFCKIHSTHPLIKFDIKVVNEIIALKLKILDKTTK